MKTKKLLGCFLVLSVLLSACGTPKNEQTVGVIKEAEPIKMVEKNDLTKNLPKEVPQKIEVSSVNPFTNAKIEVAKVIKYPTDKQKASIINSSTADADGFYAANTLFTVDGEDVPTVNTTDVDQYLQQFVDTDLYQKITFAMFYYEDNSSAVYLKTGDTSLLINGTRNILDANLATGILSVCPEDKPGPCLNDYTKNGEAKDTSPPMAEFPFIQNLSTTQKITKIIVSFGGKAKIEDNTTSGKKTLTEYISVVDNSNEIAPLPKSEVTALNTPLNMEDLGFKAIASTATNNSNNFSASVLNLQMEGISSTTGVNVNDMCKISNTKKYNFPVFELCADGITNTGLIEIGSNSAEWYYYHSVNNQAGGGEAQYIKFTPGIYRIDMDHWESLSLLGTMYIETNPTTLSTNSTTLSMVRFSFGSHKLNTNIGYHYDATYRYRYEQDQDKRSAKTKLTEEEDQWKLCMTLADTNALNGVPFAGLNKTNKTTVPLPDTLFIPTGTVFRGDMCTFIGMGDVEKEWMTKQNMFNTPIVFQAYQSVLSESVDYLGKPIDIKSLAYIRMSSDQWQKEKRDIRLEVCKFTDEFNNDNNCITDGFGKSYNFLSDAKSKQDQYGYLITVPNLAELIEEKDSTFIGETIVVKLVLPGAQNEVYDANIMLIQRDPLLPGMNISPYVKDLEKGIKLNGFLENKHFYNSKYKDTLDPSIMGKSPFGFQFAGDIILKENGVEIGRTTIDPNTYNRFDNPSLNALINNQEFYPLFDPIYFDFGLIEMQNADSRTLSIELVGSEKWGFSDCANMKLPEFPVEKIITENNGITTIIIGHHVIITIPDNDMVHCRLKDVVQVETDWKFYNFYLPIAYLPECKEKKCEKIFKEKYPNLWDSLDSSEKFLKLFPDSHHLPNLNDFVMLQSKSKNMSNAVDAHDISEFCKYNKMRFQDLCLIGNEKRNYEVKYNTNNYNSTQITSFEVSGYTQNQNGYFLQLVYIDRPMDRIAWMSPVIYAPASLQWFHEGFNLWKSRKIYDNITYSYLETTTSSGSLFTLSDSDKALYYERVTDDDANYYYHSYNSKDFIDCMTYSGIAGGSGSNGCKPNDTSNLEYMNKNGILFSLTPAPLWSEPGSKGKIDTQQFPKYSVNYYGDKTRVNTGWKVDKDPEETFMGPFAEQYSKIDNQLKANLKTAKDKFITQNPVTEEDIVDPVDSDNSNNNDLNSVKLKNSVKDCLFTIKTSDETSVKTPIGDYLGFKIDFKGSGAPYNCFDYVEGAENYGLIAKIYHEDNTYYDQATFSRNSNDYNEYLFTRIKMKGDLNKLNEYDLNNKKLCIEYTDKQSKTPSRNCIKLSYNSENGEYTSVPVSYSVIAPIDKEVAIESLTDFHLPENDNDSPRYVIKEKYEFEANGGFKPDKNPIYSSVISVPEKGYRLITVEFDSTSSYIAFNYGDWSHNQVLDLDTAKTNINTFGHLGNFLNTVRVNFMPKKQSHIAIETRNNNNNIVKYYRNYANDCGSWLNCETVSCGISDRECNVFVDTTGISLIDYNYNDSDDWGNHYTPNNALTANFENIGKE